jgi:sugar lactone lactonase YvrE
VEALHFQFALTSSAQGSFNGAASVEGSIVVSPANSHYDVPLPLAYTLNDLTGTWTVMGNELLPGTVNCGSPPNYQFYMSGSSIGPVNLGCSLASYAVGAAVLASAPLAANTSVTLTMQDNTTGSAASTLSATSTSSSVSFGSVTVGDSVTLTIGAVTQPASGTQTCQFDGFAAGDQPSPATAAGTTYTGTVSSNLTLELACTNSGGGTGPSGPTTLNGPGGMVFYKGLLYVTNGGGNQVLVFSETQTAGAVSAIVQTAAITSPNMTDPSRIAIDSSGFLYVASLGSGNGAGTITVFDTNNNYQEVTGSGGHALLTGLDRPLGVAVDGGGNLYVADNAGNAIVIYTPTTAGKPSAGYASPVNLTADKSGNQFLAPGVIYEQNLSNDLGNGNDYVLVGLGPGAAPDSVILYDAPFTTPPAPQYDLTNSTCSTMPSGPTGIALYVNLGDPLDSVIYITSFYNNNVVQYAADNFVAKLGGSVNTCPTPITNGNGINKPEGIAVDTQGNVFVSNAGGAGANANTIVMYPGGWSSNNTAPVFIYSTP